MSLRGSERAELPVSWPRRWSRLRESVTWLMNCMETLPMDAWLFVGTSCAHSTLR